MAGVPDLKRILRGTIVSRYKRCGKPGCHCARDSGHGPAYYLSVTLGPGVTRSYYVPTRLRRLVARHIGNYRKLRETLEKIIRINQELLEGGDLGDQGLS